jgi:hypothetical protein
MNIHNFEPHDSYKKIRTNGTRPSPEEEEQALWEDGFPEEMEDNLGDDSGWDEREDSYED